jgi:uncharacterized protein (TIGR00251 family)
MISIRVRVTPNAKKELVEEIEPGFLRVRVHEAPENGKANERVIELLSEYYALPESNIILKHGAKSRDKLFNIIDER